jgi:hypothetical protein
MVAHAAKRPLYFAVVFSFLAEFCREDIMSNPLVNGHQDLGDNHDDQEEIRYSSDTNPSRVFEGRGESFGISSIHINGPRPLF